MRFLLIIIAITSLPYVYGKEVAKVVELSDLEGLIPSFWLDHDGFNIINSPDLELDEELSTNEQVIPLMPIYKPGGFGKKTYIGVVVPEKYLKEKNLNERKSIFKQISSIKTDQYTLIPVQYNGKIYGLRSDYKIILGKKTTIGLSLSFNHKKTIMLGEEKNWGVSLDFGPKILVGESHGYNVMGMMQKLIDDWYIALADEEADLILDQAIRITPVLMSQIMTKSIPLTDEDNNFLEKLPADKDNFRNDSDIGIRIGESYPGHSSLWKRTIRELNQNLRKEIEWERTLAQYRSVEKTYLNEEANKFIQELCNKIARTFQAPSEIWPRCKISATLVPSARAYPGGYIYVSAGLLGILTEIDSLILVLSHEMAHIIGRHGTKEMSTHKKYAYAATFLSTAINLGLLGSSVTNGLSLLGNTGIITGYPALLSSMLGANYLMEKGNEILTFGHLAGIMLKSRRVENEADELGHEAAYASGASLVKMRNGWNEYINYFESFPQDAGIKQRLISSHPDIIDRKKRYIEREEKLVKSLEELNKKNEFSEVERNAYLNLHHTLNPYSRAYRKNLMKRFEEGRQKNQSHQVNKFRYFVNTLYGPEGRCLQHALGPGMH